MAGASGHLLPVVPTPAVNCSQKKVSLAGRYSHDPLVHRFDYRIVAKWPLRENIVADLLLGSIEFVLPWHLETQR